MRKLWGGMNVTLTAKDAPSATAGGVVAQRGMRWAVLAGVGWLVAYAGATALTAAHPQGRQFVGDIAYLVPITAAGVSSVVVAARARGHRRRLWSILVASNLLWLGGDLVWASYAYVLHREAPFPSLADALYLGSYVLVPIAIVMGFGAVSGHRRVRGLLDGAVVCLGLGALAWVSLIAPQVSYGMSWATATGIAYPMLGVIIIVVLVSVGLVGHRQVAPSLWLLGAAFTVSALTDAGYTYLASLHEYVSGAWLDLGWQTEAVLLTLAAVVALQRREHDSQAAPLARDVVMGPVLVGVVAAFAVAVIEGVRHHMGAAPLLVLALAVSGLVGRFVLSIADTRRVAVLLEAARQEQERLAVTDGLTGLYNRRFFDQILRLETARAQRESGHFAVVVVDLDHFKQVNDVHGHQSGDSVLVEAAARLRRALREGDVIARYGGEEFVILLPGAEAETAMEVAQRCRLTLNQDTIRLHSGTHLSLTASFGVAHLLEDDDPDALLRRADKALYAAKDGGRDQVIAYTSHNEDPTLAQTGAPHLPANLATFERLADLIDARLGTHEHSTAMARWAGVIADALALTPQQRTRTIHAARLHDIGKIGLSDTLLTKNGPLDEHEWTLMRTHPAIGAQLLLDVPGKEDLAAIVRGHHERYDATGYPDRIRGTDLPIETRIISVLDTWAAMLGHRPYAPAATIQEARTELHTVRGTQLDPHIVDIFLRLQAAGLIGHLHPLQAQPASAWLQH